MVFSLYISLVFSFSCIDRQLSFFILPLLLSTRREELLELIGKITAWGLAGLHLLVTSRPEPDIEALTWLLTTPAIPIQ
jgi:hypothetical protein